MSQTKTKSSKSEHDIQSEILKHLTIEGVMHWRNNTGVVKKESAYGGVDRYVRFGSVGSPDIFAFKDGKLYGIEVKTEKGKQSDDQKKWEQRLNANGGNYILARSLDHVLVFFKRTVVPVTAPRELFQCEDCSRTTNVKKKFNGHTLCISCLKKAYSAED